MKRLALLVLLGGCGSDMEGTWYVDLTELRQSETYQGAHANLQFYTLYWAAMERVTIDGSEIAFERAAESSRHRYQVKNSDGNSRRVLVDGLSVTIWVDGDRMRIEYPDGRATRYRRG